MPDSLKPHELQLTRLPCPSLYPGVCSNSSPSIQWCHPTILSSVIPFSSCLQSSPASRYFPMSQLLHQVTKIQELQLQHQPFQWIFRTDFLQYWLVWSLFCPRDSWVFSSTTVRKHQFFSTQPSLWSNSHIHTWLLEKT